MKPERPRFVLTLEPLPGDDPPVFIRLRAALKTLLRAFRFRCVQIQEIPPESDQHEVSNKD
jgi:hypothetical protein